MSSIDPGGQIFDDSWPYGTTEDVIDITPDETPTEPFTLPELCFCETPIAATRLDTDVALPYVINCRVAMVNTDILETILKVTVVGNACGPTESTPIASIGGGTTVTYPPAALTFSGETFIEALDSGIINSGSSPASYYRSIFRIPSDGYQDDAVYYLEYVGTNNDSTDRDITIEGAVSGSGSNSDPYVFDDAQSVTVPASSGPARGRSSTAFTPSSPLFLYRLTMPIGTGANSVTCYDFRVVVQHSGATKAVSEIRMLGGSGASALDQTIGGADIFRSSSTVFDPGDSSGWVSCTNARWKYEADKHGNIAKIVWWAILANASLDNETQYSQFRLYDLTASAMVFDDNATECSFQPRYFQYQMSDLTMLTDGHIYEWQIRSVKTAGAPTSFNTYVHKLRAHIYYEPLTAYEFYNRCGNLAGVDEMRTLYNGAIVPASDIIFEAHADVDDLVGAKDYGAVDTGGTATSIAATDILITDSTALFARSDDASDQLTTNDRFAATDVVQASLITRYPRVTRTPSFTPSTNRQQYLADLFDAGYLPTGSIAVLFEEGSGSPTEFFTGDSLTVQGAASWTTNGTYGTAGRAANNGDYWELPSGSLYVPEDRVTLLLIRKCHDTTNRSAPSMGDMNSFFTHYFDPYIPWTDGLVYWEFGGTGSTARLQYGGYTKQSTNLEAWAFKAGPNGLAIWKDGVELTSSNNGVASRITAGASNFGINTAGVGGTTDRQDFFFVAVIRAEISDAVLATFTVDHVLLGT